MDLANTPALQPPLGLTPNLVNPSSAWQQVLVGIYATSFVLTSIVVPLRLYTKIFIVKSWELEDYASCLGWLFFIVFMALGLDTIRFGAGLHQWDVSIQNAMVFGRRANIMEILYVLALFATKLAILLQLIRIFIPDHTRPVYFFMQGLIYLNLALYTAVFFVEIFECTPRERIWNPFIAGHCINIQLSFVISASFNVVSDLSILVFPIFWVWRLQMPQRRKVAVAAVFATGAFACVCSIMRVVWCVQTLHSVDETYDLIPVALWGDGEMLCGLLVGSLPWLPRFVGHFRPKVAATLSRSYASRRRGSTPEATSIGREKHPGSWGDNGSVERDKQGPSVSIHGNV